jgi:predicted nucleic acid-binding protein
VSCFVLDASVVAKWLLPEVHSEQALSFLASGDRLIAPELLRHEIARSLTRRIDSGEITRDEARRVSSALARMPIAVAGSPALSAAAVDVARGAGTTYADGVYLALAASLGCPLVTADRELYDGVGGLRAQGLVRWVGDPAGG